MYKIPGYIDIGINENGYLLVNYLNDLEVEIEKQYSDELKDIYIYGTNIINSKLKNFLKENSILIPKENALKNIDYFTSDVDKKLVITLLPTEECNFRCEYCGESFNSLEISVDLYESIYKFIIDTIKNKEINEVTIGWFGGEPTLKWKEVSIFTKRVRDICLEKNIHFRSHITSNGYLLSTDMFLDMLNSGIQSYQITLDGEDHDYFRVLKNKQGTYQRIINNLVNIKKLHVDKDFRIIIRHNILSTNKDFNWYDKMFDIFGTDSRFVFDIYPISQYGKDKLELNICNSYEEKIILKEKHSEYAKNAGLHLAQNLIDEFYVCTSVYKNSYYFRGNNEINKCMLILNEADEEKNKIGVVRENKVIIDEEKNKKWYSKYTYDNCWLCSALNGCIVTSCPKNKMKIDNYCEFFKRNDFPCQNK